MHDELMDDENGARATADALAISALDARIVEALDAQPEVNIPADFASRVSSKVAVRRTGSVQMAALREVRVRRTHYGYAMMMVSMVALFIAMLVLAPRAGALWVGVEWTLCVQFSVLVLWFGLRRERLR